MMFAKIFKQMIEGYSYFLYPIFSTWVLVEVIAPNSGLPTGIITAALFCLGLIGYPAAASLIAKRWDNTVFWLTMERFSLVIDYLLLAFLSGAMLFSFIFISYMITGGAPVIFEIIAELLSFFGLSGLVIRFWPLFNISFLYSGYSRWSGSGGGNVWIGPSFGTAWKMTGQDHVLRELSLPFAATAVVLILPYCLLRFHLDAKGIFLTAANFYLYAFILPYLSVMADDFAQKCLVESPFELNDNNLDDRE